MYYVISSKKYTITHACICGMKDSIKKMYVYIFVCVYLDMMYCVAGIHIHVEVMCMKIHILFFV